MAGGMWGVVGAAASLPAAPAVPQADALQTTGAEVGAEAGAEADAEAVAEAGAGAGADAGAGVDAGAHAGAHAGLHRSHAVRCHNETYLRPAQGMLGKVMLTLIRMR